MATSRLIPRSFALFLLLLLSLLPGASRAAQPAGTDLYLFWARGCPRFHT